MRLVLALCFILLGCATPRGLTNFHAIEPARVYRSAQPDADGYALLAAQGIRTVVKLNGEQLEQERAWARAAGIRLVEIALSGLWAPPQAAEDRVQAVLSDPDMQPVLVHCKWGEDRTGLAAALYRVRVQGWAPEAARAEWYELGHSHLLLGMDHYFAAQVSCKRAGKNCSNFR